MANTSIFAAFERMWQHIVVALNGKSDKTHDHDSRYYTEAEIDAKVNTISGSITSLQNTSETKTDASSKLAEAKSYADSAAAQVKNDLLNGAGGAYDTLKELGDLIDDNTDAIDALEEVAVGKADKVHGHEISDVNGLQSTLDGKVNTADLDPVAFNGYVTKGAEAGSTIGTKATVEGGNNIASSKQAHAEGGYTRAGNLTIYSEFSGSYDSYGYEHAEGYSTLAKGNSAHAEGGYTQAISSMSHAEGLSTVASGTGSHAEGSETTASGYGAHTEGYKTTASGENTHAEGNGTTASLQAAHAEGYNTTASGYASHAEGNNTKASSSYQHVQGKYNIEDTSSDYVHIVGNGSSSARANAHTLDWDGNAWFAGDVYVGSTSGTNKDEGSVKLATVVEMNAAIASIPTPDVSGQINAHNSNTSAHSDIRTAASNAASAAATAKSTADTHIANKSNPHGVTAAQLGALTAVFSAGTSAPSNTNLLWIDTTAKTGGLKYYNGSAWVHVPVAYV